MSRKIAEGVFNVSVREAIHLIERELVNFALLEHCFDKVAAVTGEIFGVLGEILKKRPSRVVVSAARECEAEIPHIGLEKVCAVACFIGGVVTVEILLSVPVAESLPPRV